jgi:hypothetical protein
MRNDSTPEIRRAQAKLAIETRWRGRGSPEVLAAQRALVAARLAAKLAEADALRAELNAMGAAS